LLQVALGVGGLNVPEVTLSSGTNHRLARLLDFTTQATERLNACLLFSYRLHGVVLGRPLASSARPVGTTVQGGARRGPLAATARSKFHGNKIAPCSGGVHRPPGKLYGSAMRWNGPDRLRAPDNFHNLRWRSARNALPSVAGPTVPGPCAALVKLQAIRNCGVRMASSAPR